MLTALNAYCRSKRVPKFQAVIAWINNWPDRYALQRIPGFREYYRGALDRAEQLGYVLEEFWLREKGITPARLVRILKARNIHALLLAPQPQAHTPPPIDYEDFSVVCFGYSMQPAILHVITNHHFHSINLLMARVMELGYTRIGLCVGRDWDDKCEHAWLGGLMLTLAKNPQHVDVPPFGGDFGDLGDFKRWLAKYKPEVVISSNEFLDALRKIGRKVPEDIGFASVAVDPRSEEISGIYQNDFLIGQRAVDLLVDMIHRGEHGVPEVPIRTLVESVWVPGRTVLPRRQVR
jgi:LacI family transcriptional regulator